MKKGTLIVVVSLILAVVIYLLGSFTAASFDIKKWDSAGRFLCGLLWASLSLCIGGIIIDYNENPQP